MTDITKLPKWAQEKLKTLELQRDAAVKALDEFTDKHQEGAITAHKLVCDKEGGPSTRKARMDANWLEIKHAGVCLQITLGNEEIQLGYYQENRRLAPVYLVPSAYQQVLLKSNAVLT